MRNGIIVSPGQELTAMDKNTKIMRVSRTADAVNKPAILGHLAQYANLANIAGTIKKGTHFVVQVPTHLQASLDTGKYTMLHGAKSEKTWATIVEKLPNGKNNFIANCPIKAEAFYQGNPFQDASASIANLQLQQQMAVLVQMIGEAYDAILRVEAGQKADRIGQLAAGRDGIAHALKMKDAESKKLAMVVARGSLQEAQGKIGEVLKQKVGSFKAVPKNFIRRFFMECTHDAFLDKRTDEYNVIQEYCELYLQATDLIAQSFIICGETDSAASVYDACRQFVADMNFNKVRTILYAHPKKKEADLFYHKAAAHITESKTLCLDAAKPYDFIEIALDGEELLEVLHND